MILGFLEWLVEARYEPEEEHSWVWHPHHGTHVAAGYMKHNQIFKDHPELRTMHSHGEEHEYAPPKGTMRVDRPHKALHYTRHDQSRFGTPGAHDTADIKDVDDKLRKRFNIPHNFKSVIRHGGDHWWHNGQKGFEEQPWR